MKITDLYDYFAGNPGKRRASLIIITVISACLALRLSFSEDISDFLPLGTSDREALSVYQDISGANNLYILFHNPDDADYTVRAIDCFSEAVQEADALGWCEGLTTQFDFDSVQQVSDFVYDNIAYFLTGEDYARMDSLLAVPGYITERLKEDKKTLMFPTGGLFASSIARDPLGLFSPVLAKLAESNSRMKFEMYDGYVFTPDMSRAVAIMSSRFGNSETEQNARLLSLLKTAISKMEAEYPGVTAHVVGGPEIAVGNSNRIKKDSVLAIALSAILIIILLTYSFRSLKNILLIFLSISWGWLFALGGMALFSDSVSIIVIGISSVILGIAVNYPLHLIAHTEHQKDMRSALKEILMPLVVGNVTTVGAFLALVPLQSTALRDLGLFASLLLVGTIVFVLLYLPHMVSIRDTGHGRRIKLLDRMASFSPENHGITVCIIVLATVVLAFFSVRTGFNSNMADINYITQEQKSDLQYFNDLVNNGAAGGYQDVYVLSTGGSYEQALEAYSKQKPLIDSLISKDVVHSHSNVSQFIVSPSEQSERLRRWSAFLTEHREQFFTELPEESRVCGFSAGAFVPFYNTMSQICPAPREFEFFKPLTEFIFSGNFTTLKDTGLCYVVDVLDVAPEKSEDVKSVFGNCFDVRSMNSALSNNLSDNFNYIGWACSLIVFFFLWFSFGRLELAVISFLPMAISWVWILGIMSLCGVQFNIVNVILATFIFGQGDDYTIFMTEGCQYEYTYHRKILSSYKSSILQSALIMFFGIGTLIFARHPAMHSLAEVTIIGMFSVVMMAYVIPPYLFRFLTCHRGKERLQPLTIASLFHREATDPVSMVRSRYIYKGKDIFRTVRRNLRDCDGLVNMEISPETPFHYHETSYGERALLLALTHPGCMIEVSMDDSECLRIAEISGRGLVDNIEWKLADAANLQHQEV